MGIYWMGYGEWTADGKDEGIAKRVTGCGQANITTKY
jgi:hypothetical protein